MHYAGWVQCCNLCIAEGSTTLLTQPSFPIRGKVSSSSITEILLGGRTRQKPVNTENTKGSTFHFVAVWEEKLIQRRLPLPAGLILPLGYQQQLDSKLSPNFPGSTWARRLTSLCLCVFLIGKMELIIAPPHGSYTIHTHEVLGQYLTHIKHTTIIPVSKPLSPGPALPAVLGLDATRGRKTTA